MAQTDKQTKRQTDGHHNSMTESAQWGGFSENQRKGPNKSNFVMLRGSSKQLVERPMVTHK